jgi:hypothetical protein
MTGEVSHRERFSMPPTHPAEKRVSDTFDALGMTINRTAFNLQKGLRQISLLSTMVFPLEMATFHLLRGSIL